MLLERAVAIKELPVNGELSDADDAMREARATARLNHPAIVSLYEIVAEPDRIYMISELAHGSTLDELIDERLLSDQDVGRIGVALCEALAHAHAHGVMHRDVKPANVMVSDEWIDGAAGRRAQPAKLMDFGIASIVDGDGATGPHAGSRGYMSPEQEAGEPASPASDVYSLALVLFESFCGMPPGRGRRGRLARTRRDLPPTLTRCVDRCLEHDSELRPELGELDAELAAALPLLNDDLNARGLLAWFRRGTRGRRGNDPGIGSDVVGSNARSIRRSASAARRTSRTLRLGCGAVAGITAALTIVATGLSLSGPTIAIAALLVTLLPRVGWATLLCAGAVVLVLRGSDGAAVMLLLPACLAAFTAAVTLTRSPVIAGALWGATAFLWVIALQATSGESLVLIQPAGMPAATEARDSVPDALQALALFAQQPAYTASIALWAAVASIASLMWLRAARLFLWSLLVALAIVAQVAIGSALHAMVPPITLVVVPPVAAAVLMLAAAATRRTGRVFGAS